MKKLVIFCTHIFDFCRLDHIYQCLIFHERDSGLPLSSLVLCDYHRKLWIVKHDIEL